MKRNNSNSKNFKFYGYFWNYNYRLYIYVTARGIKCYFIPSEVSLSSYADFEVSKSFALSVLKNRGRSDK